MMAQSNEFQFQSPPPNFDKVEVRTIDEKKVANGFLITLIVKP